MAIIEYKNVNGIKVKEVTHEGEVISLSDRYWMDGMISDRATIWNVEKQKIETIEYGYYGADCRNLKGDITAEVDLTKEVARNYLHALKRSAWFAYQAAVIAKKEAIEKGTHAIVVKGRKVAKGTKLEVFWVGERGAYIGNGTEIIAGCWDEKHNKVWIKAEYLKSIDPIKSPVAAERKKFMKSYVKRNAGYFVYNTATEERFKEVWKW